jgi:hypothetical protein
MCFSGGGTCSLPSDCNAFGASNSACRCLSLHFKRQDSHAPHCAFPHVTSARTWRFISTVTLHLTSWPHLVQDHACFHWPCEFRTLRNQPLMALGSRELSPCMFHPLSLKISQNTVSSHSHSLVVVAGLLHRLRSTATDSDHWAFPLQS